MSHGYFIGELDVRFVVDAEGEDRLALVLAPFTFCRANGECITVPAGTLYDGASIPRLCWRVIGSPFTGDYRRAAVVHDYLCALAEDGDYSSPEVHTIFREAMRADGCGALRARVMWSAVRAFGPRWT